MDHTCHDLLNSPDHPFGEITVIFGGHFQQILPVNCNESRADIIFASLLRSALWNGIKILWLVQNMRLTNNPDAQEFASWLLNVSHGHGCSENGTIPLLPGMISSDINVFIAKIYPAVGSVPPPPPKYFLDQMILAPRNSDVDDLKKKCSTALTLSLRRQVPMTKPQTQ